MHSNDWSSYLNKNFSHLSACRDATAGIIEWSYQFCVKLLNRRIVEGIQGVLLNRSIVVANFTFLTCVSITAHVNYCYRLSVCPCAVRHTLVLCRKFETAQPIVKLSSLPCRLVALYSPMILVFWGPNFPPEFQCEHPNWGALNARGGRKSCNFSPISRYSS